MENWITGNGVPLEGPQFSEIIATYWPHVCVFYAPFRYRIQNWQPHHTLCGLSTYVDARYTNGYPDIFEFHENNTIIIAPKNHVFQLNIAKEWTEMENQIDSIITARKQPNNDEFAKYYPLFASCFKITTASEIGWKQWVYYYAKIGGHYRKITSEDHMITDSLTHAEEFIARWISLRKQIFTLPYPIANEIWHYMVKI